MSSSRFADAFHIRRLSLGAALIAFFGFLFLAERILLLFPTASRTFPVALILLCVLFTAIPTLTAGIIFLATSHRSPLSSRRALVLIAACLIPVAYALYFLISSLFHPPASLRIPELTLCSIAFIEAALVIPAWSLALALGRTGESPLLWVFTWLCLPLTTLGALSDLTQRVVYAAMGNEWFMAHQGRTSLDWFDWLLRINSWFLLLLFGSLLAYWSVVSLAVILLKRRTPGGGFPVLPETEQSSR